MKIDALPPRTQLSKPLLVTTKLAPYVRADFLSQDVIQFGRPKLDNTNAVLDNKLDLDNITPATRDVKASQITDPKKWVGQYMRIVNGRRKALNGQLSALEINIGLASHYFKAQEEDTATEASVAIYTDQFKNIHRNTTELADQLKKWDQQERELIDSLFEHEPQWPGAEDLPRQVYNYVKTGSIFPPDGHSTHNGWVSYAKDPVNYWPDTQTEIEFYQHELLKQFGQEIHTVNQRARNFYKNTSYLSLFSLEIAQQSLLQGVRGFVNEGLNALSNHRLPGLSARTVIQLQALGIPEQTLIQALTQNEHVPLSLKADWQQHPYEAQAKQLFETMGTP